MSGRVDLRIVEMIAKQGRSSSIGEKISSFVFRQWTDDFKEENKNLSNMEYIFIHYLCIFVLFSSFLQIFIFKNALFTYMFPSKILQNKVKNLYENNNNERFEFEAQYWSILIKRKRL